MNKVSPGYNRGCARLEKGLIKTLPAMDDLLVRGTIGDIAVEELGEPSPSRGRAAGQTAHLAVETRTKG
jgi:hypothetical protein